MISSPRHSEGFTLVEVLIAIVLVGILAAVAVVGISNVVGKGSAASCTASADAARTASAVYFSSHLTYPTDFADLTAADAGTAGAPLALPAGTTATGLVATSSGGGWTLSMAPGTANVAPTFSCAAGGSATITTVTAPCSGSFSAWRGQYFSNISLSGVPTACRNDVAIDFDWGTTAPMVGLPADQFSVRWTRTQTFQAGEHRFTLGTDDGGRLSIDGTVVLDRWVYQSYPSSPPAVTTTLTAGPHTIVVEYFEGNGYSRATLAIAPL